MLMNKDLIQKPFQHNEYIAYLYGEKAKTAYITFQVTEDCCLSCTYCYQNHKTSNKMNYSTGKIFIDQLLSNIFPTVNTNNTKSIILDFIGGEPLLEIELIEKLVDYYFTQAILLQHPWLYFTKINLCSNGILYFLPKFQKFLQKYQSLLSFTISLDGCQELHDSCRIDHEGKGSYQQALKAVKHYNNTFSVKIPTKMTLAPSNLQYLYKSIQELIKEDYDCIYLNCVFENVWNIQDAQKLYQELIKVANYLINNNLYDKIYLSIFEKSIGQPLDENDNGNWCGGNVTDQGGFAMDYKGDFFPCIRYMESSLNGKQKPLKIGSTHNGWINTIEEKENVELLSNVTRKNCSSEKCFNCPVASGCSWCSAYNYEEFGTPKSRATYICLMHQARVLANYYFWTTLEKKVKGKTEMKLYLPKDLAIQIISEEEYNNLLI